jgi:hypothetical protein
MMRELVYAFHAKHGFDRDRAFTPVVESSTRSLFDELDSQLRAFHKITREGTVRSDRNPAIARLSLIAGELQELVDAFMKGDEVEAYDAVVDLLYVVVGTAVCYGWPVDAGFREVHHSNMTKETTGRHHPKGPDYRAPRLAQLLAWNREVRDRGGSVCGNCNSRGCLECFFTGMVPNADG